MKNALIAATALALLPLSAMAGEGTKTPEPAATGQSGTFASLDANQDGRISMPEASADAKLVESFSMADKNGDGYLDASEFSSNSTSPQPSE